MMGWLAGCINSVVCLRAVACVIWFSGDVWLFEFGGCCLVILRGCCLVFGWWCCLRFCCGCNYSCSLGYHLVLLVVFICC